MSNGTCRVRYFASLREAIGVDEELVELSGAHMTAADLLADARVRHPGAFSHGAHERLLCSVNQELSTLEAPVKAGDEVGLFPPVTGG